MARDDAGAGQGGRHPRQALVWVPETQPTWDAHKRRVFATVPPGVFDVGGEDDSPLPGEWWSAQDEAGDVVGYGWIDSTWGGDVEVLVAVDGAVRDRGVGSFVLDRLEQEAVARGVNYVYNVVREGHPERERLHDWLGVRGYRGSDRDEALRKRVLPTAPEPPAGARAATGTTTASGTAAAATLPAPTATSDGSGSPGSDRGPGQEEAGGYVDVEDHRY